MNFPRLGSAMFVFDKEGRILLGQRNKEPHKGLWVVPGGKILAFETIFDAAVREVFEETGLWVIPGGQLGTFELVNPPDEHRVIVYNWGWWVKGKLRPASDLSDAAFYPLPECDSVAVTPFIRGVLGALLPDLKQISATRF
jgi:ADP-ribose pyrophosphatase YjhB (NUDIX family)